MWDFLSVMPGVFLGEKDKDGVFPDTCEYYRPKLWYVGKHTRLLFHTRLQNMTSKAIMSGTHMVYSFVKDLLTSALFE